MEMRRKYDWKYITPGILTLETRVERQERVSVEWTDTWLSIKSEEIEHNRPRSEDTVTAGLKTTIFIY